MTNQELQSMGTFDLLRMQHVFEHFSLEESQEVLEICSSLLRSDGYLLLSVPDLEIHIQSYMDGYRWMSPFVDIAKKRIPKDSPPSFVFGFHVHQEGYSPCASPGGAHKWSYDYRGLKFQLERSGYFRDVQRLGIWHPDASMSFTHNRPHEDLCVLARKGKA
jgi:predicted SAM-dependent methyltransferase